MYYIQFMCKAHLGITTCMIYALYKNKIFIYYLFSKSWNSLLKKSHGNPIGKYPMGIPWDSYGNLDWELKRIPMGFLRVF